LDSSGEHEDANNKKGEHGDEDADDGTHHNTSHGRTAEAI